MKKSILFAAAAALSMVATPVLAGGWGGGSGGYKAPTNYSYNSHNNNSSGLLNVSPTVKLGNIGVGNGILAGSAIGSGNSILSGNNTGIGILGTGTGLLNNVVGNIRKR